MLSPQRPGKLADSTQGEERANAVTHALGIILSLAATAWLSFIADASGNALQVITYPVFGVSAVLLYTVSTIYHLQVRGDAKRRMKMIDHISIYYLIAGTYTPVTLVGLGGAWGWSLFGVVWALALAGTVFKLFFTGRYPKVSTALYVAMGWTAIVAIVPLVQTLRPDTLLWILGGGVAYTGGVAFYAWKRLPYNHALWHLCVLAGTACHVMAVAGL
ncbi:MAG: PAQR family membrane homeostasis protein TrhA [Spirochaetota bacterium]